MRRTQKGNPFLHTSLQFASFQSLKSSPHHPVITNSISNSYRPNRQPRFHTTKQYNTLSYEPQRRKATPEKHRDLMDVIQVRLHKIHTREHLRTDYSVHKDQAKRYLAKNVNKGNMSNYSRKMMILANQQTNMKAFIPSRLTQAHQETVKMTGQREITSKRPSTAKQTVSRKEESAAHTYYRRNNSRVVHSSKEAQSMTNFKKESQPKEVISAWDTNLMQQTFQDRFQPFLKTYY